MLLIPEGIERRERPAAGDRCARTEADSMQRYWHSSTSARRSIAEQPGLPSHANRKLRDGNQTAMPSAKAVDYPG